MSERDREIKREKSKEEKNEEKLERRDCRENFKNCVCMHNLKTIKKSERNGKSFAFCRPERPLQCYSILFPIFFSSNFRFRCCDILLSLHAYFGVHLVHIESKSLPDIHFSHRLNPKFLYTIAYELYCVGMFGVRRTSSFIFLHGRLTCSRLRGTCCDWGVSQ